MSAAIEPGTQEPPVTAGLTWRDWWPVGIAAILALLLAAGLVLLFGSVSPLQRDRALVGLAGSVVWLAASVIGACGTIAALMLTTVGLMEHLETQRLTPPLPVSSAAGGHRRDRHHRARGRHTPDH